MTVRRLGADEVPLMDSALSVCISPVAVEMPSGAVVVGGVSHRGDIVLDRLDGPGEGDGAERAVLGRTQPDDHNNPAVFAADGHLPWVAWQRHGHRSHLSARVGTTPGDVPRPGVGEWLPEVKITGWPNITYAEIHHIASRDTTNARTYLVLSRSTLYVWRYTFVTIHQGTGALSWSPPRELLNHAVQGYVLTAADPVPRTSRIRFAAYTHFARGRDHVVRYGEISPNTLDVVTAEGAVLGNLETGEGLPLTRGDLEPVFTPSAGWTSWPLAVRGHPAGPAVLVATWPLDLTRNARYQHVSRVGPQSWNIQNVGEAGSFIGRRLGSREDYPGGGCYPSPSSGDDLWTVDESGGTWSLNRLSRPGSGAWALTTRLTVTGKQEMYRPRPVIGSSSVAVRTIDRYASFTDYLAHTQIVRR